MNKKNTLLLIGVLHCFIPSISAWSGKDLVNGAFRVSGGFIQPALNLVYSPENKTNADWIAERTTAATTDNPLAPLRAVSANDTLDGPHVVKKVIGPIIFAQRLGAKAADKACDVLEVEDEDTRGNVRLAGRVVAGGTVGGLQLQSHVAAVSAHHDVTANLQHIYDQLTKHIPNGIENLDGTRIGQQVKELLEHASAHIDRGVDLPGGARIDELIRAIKEEGSSKSQQRELLRALDRYQKLCKELTSVIEKEGDSLEFSPTHDNTPTNADQFKARIARIRELSQRVYGAANTPEFDESVFEQSSWGRSLLMTAAAVGAQALIGVFANSQGLITA